VELEYRLGQLSTHLGETVCAVCGQQLPEASHHKLEAERDEIHELLETDDLKPLSVEELQVRIQDLRPFGQGSSTKTRLLDLDQDLRLTKFRRDRKESRIAEIGSLLEGSAVEIGSIEEQRRDREAEKQQIAEALAKTDLEESILRRGRNDALAELAKVPDLPPLASEKLKVYAEAAAIVKGSFDGFRYAMRKRIEAAATEIFRSLTTEKEYQGVRLNEDYSLSVLDDQGVPLRRISAGANQILTMSFIGALSAASVDEAPMVMDTPLGRLDKGHRRAIMEWVASMQHQVILFVQSGEYDPETDRKLLGTKVGREFEIRRLGAKRSEVVAV
jgi:DNA sulfur modification protein DndD